MLNKPDYKIMTPRELNDAVAERLGHEQQITIDQTADKNVEYVRYYSRTGSDGHDGWLNSFDRCTRDLMAKLKERDISYDIRCGSDQSVIYAIVWFYNYDSNGLRQNLSTAQYYLSLTHNFVIGWLEAMDEYDRMLSQDTKTETVEDLKNQIDILLTKMIDLQVVNSKEEFNDKEGGE